MFHMSRCICRSLTAAASTITDSTTATMLAYPADEWLTLVIAALFVVLVCDVHEGLQVVWSVDCACVIYTVFFVAPWIHMWVWIVQTVLWTVYQVSTVTTSGAVMLCVRALIFWLFGTLWRSCERPHRVWELTLAFSDDLQRLFLVLKDQAFLVTVWSCVGK